MPELDLSRILLDPQGILGDVRSFPFGAVRLLEDCLVSRQESDKRTLEGHAVVFDTWTPIGPADNPWWMERIAKGATKRSLSEDDQRALWNHNADKVLGRVSAGTLELREDSKGLRDKVRMPNWASAELEMVERRDVTQQSFGFDSDPEHEEWEQKEINGQKVQHRTIRRMSVREVSPGVAFPAYPTTDLQARSIVRSLGVRPEVESPDFDGMVRAFLSLYRKQELDEGQRSLVEALNLGIEVRRPQIQVPDMDRVLSDLSETNKRIDQHLQTIIRRLPKEDERLEPVSDEKKARLAKLAEMKTILEETGT